MKHLLFNDKSLCPEVLRKKVVLKNFAKVPEKHRCRSVVFDEGTLQS